MSWNASTFLATAFLTSTFLAITLLTSTFLAIHASLPSTLLASGDSGG